MSLQLSDTSLLKTDSFINGQFVYAPSDRRFEVRNPSDNSLVAAVADFGADGISAAIDAAQAAQPAWAATTAKERAGLLRRWYEL
jgi:succinate-semialdehyde dehydrogenase/glutarate-semialdehyde dehydrogenase